MRRFMCWLREIDRTTVLCVCALVILPAVILAINRSWLFAREGWLDPWIYSGYHVHFATLWRDFPSAYYGARMPWTLIGWIVFRMAGGVEAYLYILALFLFYVSTFSLFHTIRLLFGSPLAGFVAACLLATNSWFLWSIGWHYIDGPMIAFILLAFAALSEAACGRRWRLASVLFGASVAATIALFSPNLVLVPVFAGVFVALNYLGQRRPIGRVGLFWISGFIGAMLAMCVANWSLGGWFLFFAPQFQVAPGLLSLRAGMPQWEHWFWSAPWLLFPAFSFLASIAILVARGPTAAARLRRGDTAPAFRNENILLVLAGACFVTTAGFLCMEAMRLGMLAYLYHANELWPFAFFVIAGCVALGMSRLPKRQTYALAISAPILCLAPWLAASIGWITVPLPTNAEGGPLLFSGHLIEPLWMFAGAALLFCIISVSNLIVPAIAVAFVSFVSVLTVTIHGPFAAPHDGSARNIALAIYDIVGFVDKTQSQSGPLPIWWDPKDPNNEAFQSLNEMLYLRYNPANTPPVVAPGDRVIFLSSNRALPNTAEPALRARHLELTPLERTYIERGSTRVDVTIAQITPGSSTFKRIRIPLSEIAPPPPPGSTNAPIATAPQAWSYAAELQIPQAIKREHPGRAYIRLELRVDDGVLGAGATLADGNTFIDRKFYLSSPEIHDIFLTIPALRDAKQIVVTNGDHSSSSTGVLYSAEIDY